MAGSKEFCVGIVRCSYNEEKNFVYADDDLVRFRSERAAVDFIRQVWHRVSGVAYSRFLHSFAFPVNARAKILHCFNAIVLSRHPWVVTFESTLPRYPNLPKWLLRLAWSRLASDKCRAIIAFSECSKHIFLTDLDKNNARISRGSVQAIRSKLQTLHPPQHQLVNEHQKFNIVDFDGTLNLALVGHDFFRKGGLELLVAVDELLQEHADIQLTIVSKMNAGDYASRAGDSKINLANDIIAKYPHKILVEESLTPEAVLELLKQSHILCLPTWGETFGYSVLEGQAAGCAAITTNLRALPEINNSECGWVIDVPKLASGDGDIDTLQKREIFREKVTRGVKAALLEALNDRQMLRNKSQMSLARIRAHHDPQSHKATLVKIYSGG
ncbi:MAG: glycosyltransferase family 4 protein [Phormidesmis sp.]